MYGRTDACTDGRTFLPGLLGHLSGDDLITVDSTVKQKACRRALYCDVHSLVLVQVGNSGDLPMQEWHISILNSPWSSVQGDCFPGTVKFHHISLILCHSVNHIAVTCIILLSVHYKCHCILYDNVHNHSISSKFIKNRHHSTHNI